MKILAISGSIRKNSYNTKFLQAAQNYLPKGVEMEIYVPESLPLFSQDLEKNLPQEVVFFKEKILNSNALLFCTPEHNFTIPAVLKNAIEWGNRPFGDNSFFGKPAAIMGVSTSGFSTVRAQNHLRQVFVDLSVVTFLWPQMLVGEAEEKFEEGELKDARTQKKLASFLKSFQKFVEGISGKEHLFTTR